MALLDWKERLTWFLKTSEETESQLVVFKFTTLAYNSAENSIKIVFTMMCQLEMLKLGLYVSSPEHLLCTWSQFGFCCPVFCWLRKNWPLFRQQTKMFFFLVKHAMLSCRESITIKVTIPCRFSIQMKAIFVGRTVLNIIQIVSFNLYHCIFCIFKTERDDFTLNFQVLLLLCSVFESTECLIGVLTIHYLFILWANEFVIFI